MITLKKNGLRIRNSETESFEDVAGFVAPAGQNGEKGEKGDTPVRGVDYWTEEDVNAMQSYIDNALTELPPSVKITKSTEDLVDGESLLADGEVYVVI